MGTDSKHSDHSDMGDSILLAILAVMPVLAPLLVIACTEPGWETRRQAQIVCVCGLAIIIAVTL